MSFKGRINPNLREFGVIDEVTTNFEENILEIYSVEEVNITTGMTIQVTHDYDSNFDYNYRIYIINSSGTPIRFIGDYSSPSITHAIADEGVAGVAFQANDNPSGTYKIAWDVQIIDGSLIEDPVDCIKHIKKLQNWSELPVLTLFPSQQ